MIWAKVVTSFEAQHYYKEAKKPVEFLKYPHHHRFFVTVWVEQLHDNRDVEYYTFKWELDKFLRKYEDVVHMNSCEKFAEETVVFIKSKYSDRKIKVEVTEDGFDGALVEV